MNLGLLQSEVLRGEGTVNDVDFHWFVKLDRDFILCEAHFVEQIGAPGSRPNMMAGPGSSLVLMTGRFRAR